MRSKLTIVVTIGVLLVTVFWLNEPVTGVTDGHMRRVLEASHFGERIIQATIYPKSSHDVYQKQKRQFVHGLPRVTQEYIYEPDVYTWELAIKKHRREIDTLQPPAPPPPGTVQPVPMAPTEIAPVAPNQVYLTPLGDGQIIQQVPSDADVRMQHLLDRARAAGMKPDSTLKAQSIKQRLLDHMQGTGSDPANQYQAPPNLPVLSLPQGKRGDSFDSGY